MKRRRAKEGGRRTGGDGVGWRLKNVEGEKLRGSRGRGKAVGKEESEEM